MEYEPKGEIVEIAYVSDNKVLFSTDAFREILEKVGDLPVSVVSINGLANKDKPYIFSQFIKYLRNCHDKNWFNIKNDKEFKWRNSPDRKSPGISMYSEPVIIRKSGDEVAVIFMDTQGCFDRNKLTPENLLIFVLSFVLSSTLIYDIREELSEELFHFLQLFVEYAKGSSDAKYNLVNLIFMMRGLQFSDEYEFGFHSSFFNAGEKNYKQDKFFIDPDPENMTEEIQFNHEFTDFNFLRISCCLLPVNESQSYDKNLPTAYTDAVKHIVPRILHPSNVVLKRVGDHMFNGSELIKFFNQLAIIFNKNEIRTDRNADEFNAEVHILAAQLTAFNYYIWEMDKVIQDKHYTTDKELKIIHSQNMEKAMAVFSSKKSLKYQMIENKYYDSLSEMIQNAFEYYVQANGIKSEFRKMRNKTSRMRDEMEMKIKETKYKFFSSFTELNSDVSKLVGFDHGDLNGVVRSVIGQVTKNAQF